MKTPRQGVGADLKPATILLPPDLRAWLDTLATQERRSFSYIVRDILDAAKKKAEP